MAKAKFRGEPLEYAVGESGQVYDFSTTDEEDAEEEEIEETPSERNPDGIQTESERFPDVIQTLSGRSSDEDETLARRQTENATLSRLLSYLGKDKAKIELEKYPDARKELEQKGFVKNITGGLYDLNTLPVSGQKQLTDYFKGRYGLDKTKTMQLVLLVRLYKRVPKWVLVIVNIGWITILSLVLYYREPKPKIETGKSKIVLTASERKKDSVYVQRWANKHNCQFWQMRYDYILTDPNFHNGSKAEREKILKAHKDTIDGKFK